MPGRCPGSAARDTRLPFDDPATGKWLTGSAGYAALVPHALPTECRALLDEGLRRDYVRTEQVQPVLRGQLDLRAQLTHRYGVVDRLHVRNFERRVDTWENLAQLPLPACPHLGPAGPGRRRGDRPAARPRAARGEPTAAEGPTLGSGRPADGRAGGAGVRRAAGGGRRGPGHQDERRDRHQLLTHIAGYTTPGGRHPGRSGVLGIDTRPAPEQAAQPLRELVAEFAAGGGS
ncbi:hypothetical protein [Streptomyces sp. NPDC101165]|uniref:5-methylcytosine restriction system specificity protein McrC n=1 Tax=Streptomyces sp. NPDC101165 TaxID=3366119 RepID=UPI00380F9CD0